MQENELIVLAERVETEEPTDRLAMALVELDYHIAGGIGLGVNYDPLLWMERNGTDPLMSTDAAMMLVPDGWFTRVAYEDRHSHSWRWELRGGFGWEAASRAPTQARAITAAALRARSAIRAATLSKEVE